MKNYIKLENISKQYNLRLKKPTLIENIYNKGRNNTIWALKDINLKISKGEKIGIIGPNGAGKTTLLEIISGITIPTTGKLETNCKIVSLIDLDAGFHPDLTGRENLLLNGLLVEMSKNYLAKKTNSIIKFAELEKFIDSPLSTYSSGMSLRLGFSIAIHSEFDTLVLDEHISVGDHHFQEKSLKMIKKIINKDKTLILVSHQLNLLLQYCDRLIWIDYGKIMKDGKCKAIIEEYRKSPYRSSPALTKQLRKL